MLTETENTIPELNVGATESTNIVVKRLWHWNQTIYPGIKKCSPLFVCNPSKAEQTNAGQRKSLCCHTTTRKPKIHWCYSRLSRCQARVQQKWSQRTWYQKDINDHIHMWVPSKSSRGHASQHTVGEIFQTCMALCICFCALQEKRWTKCSLYRYPGR